MFDPIASQTTSPARETEPKLMASNEILEKPNDDESSNKPDDQITQTVEAQIDSIDVQHGHSDDADQQDCGNNFDSAQSKKTYAIHSPSKIERSIMEPETNKSFKCRRCDMTFAQFHKKLTHECRVHSPRIKLNVIETSLKNSMADTTSDDLTIASSKTHKYWTSLFNRIEQFMDESHMENEMNDTADILLGKNMTKQNRCNEIVINTCPTDVGMIANDDNIELNQLNDIVPEVDANNDTPKRNPSKSAMKDSKRFDCSHCTYKFKTNDLRNAHERRVHTQSRSKVAENVAKPTNSPQIPKIKLIKSKHSNQWSIKS